MPGARRITVRVPADLLHRALRASGVGITETVRHGLEFVVARGAQRKLRQLRGRVGVAIGLAKLREDR